MRWLDIFIKDCIESVNSAIWILNSSFSIIMSHNDCGYDSIFDFYM